jgi:hypothetical protein
VGRLHAAFAQANEWQIVGLQSVAEVLSHTILSENCRFAHRAVLVFPTSLHDAIVYFAERGLDPAVPVPSVIVRSRLCARYELDAEACAVSVTRLRTSRSVIGHDVEVFLFPMTAATFEPRIVQNERNFGFEDHLAFEVLRPDVPTLERLLTALQHDAGLVFEGGGHNPYEGASGSTVLYFIGERPGSGPKATHRFQRLELYCKGDFSAVVEGQRVDNVDVQRLYSSWSKFGAPLVSSAA